MPVLRLKIYCSTPEDLVQEKLIVARVFAKLQKEFNAFIEIQSAASSSEADIALYILWCSLGDGKSFEEAAEAYLKKGFPDLLVYKKTAEAPLKETTKELKEFLDRWFGNPLSGFKAAFHTFNAQEEFETRLEAHLRKLIQEKLPQYNLEEYHALNWDKGSPYRGLEYYNEEYAGVFFGRNKDIEAVKNSFVYQASRACAFMLLLGMSGSGKSSLARAGILPFITARESHLGTDLWEKVVFLPSGNGEDLIHSFLKSFGEEYLPLEEDFAADLELGTDRLKDMLKLKGYIEKEKGTFSKIPEIKIFLFIDQFEDIFLNLKISEEQRKCFISLLYSLAHSGVVWILCAMRSDFYNWLEKYPELMEMKEGKGQYDLQPPGFAELVQIIEKPAEAAGLTFEIDPEKGISLKDMILEEAGGSTNNLPLVQFTLNELYKKKTDNNVLTFKTYNELGGLKGSIAASAEKHLMALGKDSEEALKKVFRELITLNPQEPNTIWSKGVSEDPLCNTPEKRKLVDAFVSARLLVLDKNNQGVGIVKAAHTALLTNWPRITDLIKQDMDFFKVREQLLINMTRWQENGRQKDFLIPRGKQLNSAVKVLQFRSKDILEELTEYIRLSIDRVKKEKFIKSIAAIFVSAVLIVLGIFIYFQWNQQQKNTDAVKRQEALKKLETAASMIKEQNRLEAVKNSLWVLNNLAQKETALLNQGEELLYNSLFLPNGADNVLGLITQNNNIISFTFNNKGNKFLVSSTNGVLSLYSTHGLNKLKETKGETWNQVLYLNDDKKILASAPDKFGILDGESLKVIKTFPVSNLSGISYFGSDKEILGFTNPEETELLYINLISLEDGKIKTTCKLPFDNNPVPFFKGMDINDNCIAAAYDEAEENRTAVVIYDNKTGEPLHVYYLSQSFTEMKLLNENTLRIAFNNGIIEDYQFGGDTLVEKSKVNLFDLVKDFSMNQSKISFSKELNRAAVLTKSGYFAIDVNRNQLILSINSTKVKSIQLSNDGSQLMALTDSNQFFILSIGDNNLIRPISTSSSKNFPQIEYSPAAKCFLSKITDKQLQMITASAQTGKEVKGVKSLGMVNSTVSSYSNRYVVSQIGTKLYLFDTDDESNVKSLDVPAKSNFTAFKNSNYGYVETYEDEIWIVDLESGKIIKKLKANSILAEGKSGSLLVYDVDGASTGLPDTNVLTKESIGIYDLETQKESLIELNSASDGWLSKVCINSKEDKLAVGLLSNDKSSDSPDIIEIWDIKNNKLDKKFQIKFSDNFGDLLFSSDDKYLFITPWKSSATQFYEISGGKLIEDTTEDFKHLFMTDKTEGEVRSYWADKPFKISKAVYDKINTYGVVSRYFISPSSHKVAAYYEDLSLKVFNLSDGKEIIGLLNVPDTAIISFNEKEDGLRILYSDVFGVRRFDFPFISREELIKLAKQQTDN